MNCPTPTRPHIGLSGRAQSGKNAASEALIEAGWQPLAFADTLRDVAYATDPLVQVGGITRRLAGLVDARGWDEAKKNPDVRRYLQRLGTDGVRDHLGRDVWVDAAMRKATRPTVFTDVRFPNEAAAVRNAGGIVVRIERPGLPPVLPHISETALDGWRFDHVIVNDGTLDDLHRQILGLVA